MDSALWKGLVVNLAPPFPNFVLRCLGQGNLTAILFSAILYNEVGCFLAEYMCMPVFETKNKQKTLLPFVLLFSAGAV